MNNTANSGSNGNANSRWLLMPVERAPGVGPLRAELLARLEITTLRDLLFYFPRDWQDLTSLQTVDQLLEGRHCALRGMVEEVDVRNSGVGRSICGVLIRQDRQFVRAVWFNQPYWAERFRRGQDVLLEGKPKFRGRRWEFPHPAVRWLDADEPDGLGRMLPVYRLTEGLSQGNLRSIMRGAIGEFAPRLEEVFPPDYLAEHNLYGIGQALSQLHFPDNANNLAAARRRLVFQELLIMQLALAMRRKRHAVPVAAALPVDARIDARIRKLFPFAFTDSQQAAIADISRDLARPQPMNRLLQGDVGSGKTAVAVYAMLAAVAHGQQAVLMAPTEVLARQHWRTLSHLLADRPVRRALVVGGMPTAERNARLAQIQSGELSIVVGTQALLEDDVRFARLGVAVIDEQHKFGVRQRANLKAAGLAPHYLVMTATPIPRTMAMTLYGDLDVSTLAGSPPGRRPVHTYWVTPPQTDKWWEWVRKKLAEGRQAYIVTPLVEQGESATVAGAEETFQEMQAGPLAGFRIALLHGRMESRDKERILERFRRREFDALVATSVVEVGLDVPNATVMTIRDGQRFGLAALHQLRGRVRRGEFPGFCGVFAEPNSDEGRQRLEAFVASTDGFELAEIDFRLRGPGELFGTRQHGLPPLYIANLTTDTEILQAARREAQQLVDADPTFSQPAWEKVKAMVLRRYGETLELSDVG